MICVSAVGLLSALVGVAVRADEARAATDRPKTILLGFDGVDSELTRRWMDEGHLPNLARLAETGTFAPLSTANPAQSPVSWAVLETASNPGKTNIPDFVRRAFSDIRMEGGEMQGGLPKPQLAGVEPRMTPAAEVGDLIPLDPAERFLFSLGDPGRAWPVVLGGALLVLLVFGFGLRLVFRLPKTVSLAGGLGLAVAAAFFAQRALAEVPESFPVPVTEMKGERFWDVLGRAGVRFTGLQVPGAFPCVTDDNAKILAGLFTPDVAGGVGSWYVYTNDEWTLSMDTTTGGEKIKVFADPDGVIRTRLDGPRDFVTDERFKRDLEAVKLRLEDPHLDEVARAELEDRQSHLRSERRDWSEYHAQVSVPFEIRPDYDGRKAELVIGGAVQEVAEGGWSDYFRINFHITRLLQVRAIARVLVAECGRDEHGNVRLRLFVPPLSISPEWQPPVLRLSSPRGYAAELAEDVGLFDTVGWACYTNAVKDKELAEQPFMEGLEFVLGWREAMMNRELDRGDFDVFFHLESVTDRAGHMMYRFMDPKSPLYDDRDLDGRLLREAPLTVYGRTFPMKDALLETYREMDRVVGGVMERIERGELGPGATLMVVSDHGFQPFRWGVNLNVWLQCNGYLVTKGQAQEGNVGQLIGGVTGDMLSYVDWSRTKAYALGLGKIYINLEGREPRGIVPRSEFAELKREMIAKLEAFTDPTPDRLGQRVVRKAYDGAAIYSGPYSEEPGDVIVGFEPGYRVSWQTALGGWDKAGEPYCGVVTNREPWTGDHCGVDPSLVKGVFFCNRRVKLDGEPDLINVAPTICAMYGVATPAEWDGTPLAVE